MNTLLERLIRALRTTAETLERMQHSGDPKTCTVRVLHGPNGPFTVELPIGTVISVRHLMERYGKGGNAS